MLLIHLLNTILNLIISRYIKRNISAQAYFSVQYYTLCEVLIEKCAVLNLIVCSTQILRFFRNLED